MYNKNAWNKYKDEKSFNDLNKFAEGYKEFITYGKTERLCTKKAVEILEAHGFMSLEDRLKCSAPIKSGDKVYLTNKGKNVIAFVIGKKGIKDGLRILGAHIDSPRLDLKQSPLYEAKGFSLLNTHYYGGIKKYQWVTIPLSLYGVICKKDGTTVDVAIGDKPGDPVFGISDLLIHLSADQLQKKATNVIEGEDLDLTFGSIPLNDDDKEAVKKNILDILKKEYNIEEEDFLSAEIEVVPQGPAHDYGLDRSMIAGYGHDDRSCAYTSLMAIADTKEVEYTSCMCLVDKEEIGSVGATGAHSYFFENAIIKLIETLNGSCSILDLRETLENSEMLSSDVSTGFDPLYASANDPQNAAYLGNGIVFNKYTGARGKSGSNDAMPEYFAKIRKVMDDNNINFQTAELGKVDQGGGGTIAYILGNMNMNVVDAGIAVLNMHAPMEIVSKVDVYEAYLAYKAFLKN